MRAALPFLAILALAGPALAQSGAARQVDGLISDIYWNHPVSEITVRDAAGRETMVRTDDDDALTASGITPNNLKVGKPISIRAEIRNGGLFASPASMSSAGEALVKAAAPLSPVAELARRAATCGAKPDFIEDEDLRQQGKVAVEAAINAWLADCDSRLVQAARAEDITGRSVITNAVIRGDHGR